MPEVFDCHSAAEHGGFVPPTEGFVLDHISIYHLNITLHFTCLFI